MSPAAAAGERARGRTPHEVTWHPTSSSCGGRGRAAEGGGVRLRLQGPCPPPPGGVANGPAPPIRAIQPRPRPAVLRAPQWSVEEAKPLSPSFLARGRAPTARPAHSPRRVRGAGPLPRPHPAHRVPPSGLK